jgi:anion-transporting  ArsA/GET3 family ATPase
MHHLSGLAGARNFVQDHRREADSRGLRRPSPVVRGVRELLRKDAVVITLGTGGVGKTTIAAALGLAAARAGRNTALVTVDPARRLRDALGLSRLGGKPTRLSRSRLQAAGLDPQLQLAALMLDVKGAWDDLIERFATEGARARILSNPFYRQLSSQFAGSEAYAALEKLYDLHIGGKFDALVVDTPPAANAFEFLQAPARLTRLLDLRAARWLFTPYLSAGRFAFRLVNRAARFVIKELEHFAGSSVLSSISEFFVAAERSMDGIVEQFRKTEALLHSPDVSFVLVTTAEEERLRQARALIEQMTAEGLHLSAVVINRFLDEDTWAHLLHGSGIRAEPMEAIAGLRGRLGAELEDSPGLSALVGYLEDYQRTACRDLMRVASFTAHLPPGVGLSTLPELREGVRGLRHLRSIADYLMGPQLRPARLQAVTRHLKAGVGL